MVRKVQGRLICILALLSSAALQLPAQDQEQEDSLVRLMKGKSLELIEKYGRSYRKAVDATFLHNGTYLICDTALWDVDRKTIRAEGHVRVIQGETELTSETLDYLIDEDLAKFRGGVVQLRNKENNVLRTRILDYNTKDSVAVFKSGASMKDSDGQVIESMDGTYDSGKKLFTFERAVNMYTDTTFVKTTKMTYDSGLNKANFVVPIDFWKDGDMLSAGSGWYDRGAETFFFTRNVHGLTADQEVWCDSLYFYRTPNDVMMLGRVQVQDSSRSVAGLADYMYYCDSLSRITMRKRAAVAMETDQDGQKDTLYFGADTLVYYTVPRCDVSEGEVKASEARIGDMMLDPVQEFRRKAAEAARQAAEEAAKDDPNLAGRLKAANAGKTPSDQPVPGDDQAGSSAAESVPAAQPVPAAAADTVPSADSLAVVDSLAAPADSVPSLKDSLQALRDTVPAPFDSLKHRMDSLALVDSLARADSLRILDSLAHRDTTKIGFLEGVHNVKIFRKDMQVKCDSMRYTDLDSIARFYVSPIVWNDGNRQYTSDSLFVLVRDGGIDRASLMSNAFVITQEDTVCYDQIKGTDIMAYFDSTSALRRFDALGGASAIFYLQENDAYATVNKVESKMLSAVMENGELSRVFYFESPKNDAYPIVQMKESDKKMKGFNWVPEEKPSGPSDVTTLVIRPLERSRYLRREKPVFKQTDIYFPGYMDKVYKALDERKVRKRTKTVSGADTLSSPLAVTDSLAALRDSTVAAPDSLLAGTDSTAAADSLAAYSDSVSVKAAADSLDASSGPALSDKELKALQRKERAEEREEARKLRIARRDARWAEMDARDAEKAAAKARKALEKRRERTRKAYIKQTEQAAYDDARLQKYIERYEKQKTRDERKQQSVPARKRASRTEAGRSVQTPPES